MNRENLIPNKLGTMAIIILIIIILLPLGYSLASYVLVNDVDEMHQFLEMPAPEHKNCVRDTDYMRYHHWELLRGIREEIVRHGKRGDVGLSKCMDCHTKRENFCDKCHNAVSMTPDCFGCHYYP